MMKLINLFKQFFFNYFFIFLGAAIFLLYIWLRFLRERLPKDVPFILSLLGFIILIELCAIYFYIVFSLLFEKGSTNPLVKQFVDLLYKPLEDFDAFLKSAYFIRFRFNAFILWLSYKLRFFIIKTNLFYVVFAILPRVILISVFMIDIFYFQKLKFIYYFIWLGIPLFLNKYIIYCIKALKKELFKKLSLEVTHVLTEYEFGIHPSEWPENYDPDDPDNDEVPETMSLPLEVFLEYYIKNVFQRNTRIKYDIISCHDAFRAQICKTYNVPYTYHLSREIMEKHYKLLDKKLDRLIYIEELLMSYSFAHSHNKIIKWVKIGIFTSYFFCWLYLLLKSYSQENVIQLIILIIQIKNNEEPFSGITL